jgi:hypothetical protein
VCQGPECQPAQRQPGCVLLDAPTHFINFPASSPLPSPAPPPLPHPLQHTQVVLLSDKGLSVSQRSLSVYCQVHRLLLAVCEHWGLWATVARRLDAFATTPAARIKAQTPNLGLLLPLLSVGSPSRHSWGRMSNAILGESLSRGVMWMCKKDPSLVEVSVVWVAAP